MSPRLSSLHELTPLFPTDVHDQNFIHTDLKPENILLEDATFDTIIRVSCPLTSTADPRAHAEHACREQAASRRRCHEIRAFISSILEVLPLNETTTQALYRQDITERPRSSSVSTIMAAECRLAQTDSDQYRYGLELSLRRLVDRLYSRRIRHWRSAVSNPREPRASGYDGAGFWTNAR